MARRTIGSSGLEQGGPNLGNDYGRNITREVTADDTQKIVIPKKKKTTARKTAANKAPGAKAAKRSGR
ncbi:hypothetical protein ACFOTA_03585 [Chitinophaga sp. GCM10012297]|uniref:Uncharacterized protein n=1 Tax=Chitinophaga chungangae TaxID=2821488 RepID=A0ABS3Y9C3_9BACT|nr:hypothetical protein [Chitinophaga chungangae]MBO9151274.1 hypothetical protein [Chitinophaga chungangae]